MSFDKNFVRSPEMIQQAHMPHAVEPIPSAAQLEEKLALQEVELEQLLKDNHILTSSQRNLVQNVASARAEADRLREHIRSIQTEGDIEIRIKLEKYSKLEADIRSGDTIKNELQEAHKEVQNLKTAKTELTAKTEQATKELDSARSNIKKIPGMHVQLDNLRQENIRLRKSFEYEKSLNLEKVEQMKKMEKDIVNVSGENERLRVLLSDAEKRLPASAPLGYQHVNQQPKFAPPVQETSGYADSSGAPQLQTIGGSHLEVNNQYDPFQVLATSLQPVISAPVSSLGVAANANAANPTSCGSSDMSYGET